MPTILVTGAAGFIGRSCVDRWREKYRVIAIDNLVNPRSVVPDGAEFYKADVRDIADIPLPRIDAVVHLAAQTAVTLSESSPSADYTNNIETTMRLIEWAGDRPLLYSSTNKVYGTLHNVQKPIGIDQPIEPQTPYGVTKAAADLLVQELSPNGLCLRQSCICGPMQQGSEDQGWVAHLLRQHRNLGAFTIFGDGKQVRDLLHVEDLIDLYEMLLEKKLGGWTPGLKYFVVGGGKSNAISVLGALERIKFRGEIQYGEARSKDQHYFVSANEALMEWKPQRNSLEWLDACAETFEMETTG